MSRLLFENPRVLTSRQKLTKHTKNETVSHLKGFKHFKMGSKVCKTYLLLIVYMQVQYLPPLIRGIRDRKFFTGCLYRIGLETGQEVD